MKVEHFIKKREREEKDKIIADPEMLERLYRKETGRKIKITPFDPLKIESEVEDRIPDKETE